VVLDLPQYFFHAPENLLKTCSTLILIWLSPPATSCLLPPYLRRSPPPSRRAFITLHSLALRRPPTTLIPCRQPPPLVASHRVASRRVVSRCVVPRPRLSRLRRWSEGTAASPHPSLSRRRRGKIPSIVVVLRSDDDASRRPPPPSSRAVQHLLS
jgi:hypothetical protein